MTHASLYTGIGGANLAASWLGWKNIFHCDNNDFIKQVHYCPVKILDLEINRVDHHPLGR